MNAEVKKDAPLEQRILENLSAAILLFSSDLRLLYINPAGEMLFGVSARHIAGRSAKGLLPCRDEQLETKFNRALETGLAFTEREIKLQMSDRREMTVNCSVEPLFHTDEARELLVEIHRVDRHLRISREEHLLSQHKATQALVRGLAHEIKNPLGGLRGAAQLLEQELPDPALREYTRIVIEEADRLQALMDRMLGPNRILSHKAVNIHRVLERVRQLVAAESGPQISIRSDYDPSIPDVSGDQDQLIQALLNIMRNATRAVADGGQILLRTRVLRQFTIGNRRHRLVLLVEVEDDGPGIPPELQERIFLPMVSGADGGSGLGLTIAQNLVSQHGGLIECRSKPGETVFSLYLPLDRAPGDKP